MLVIIAGGILGGSPRHLPSFPFKYHPLSQQPWIVGLLSFHALLLAMAVATRRWPNVQLGLFLAICATVYCATYINSYGGAHWRELGFTQDYFDRRGVFISFLFSMPMLLVAGYQMVRGQRRGPSKAALLTGIHHTAPTRAHPRAHHLHHLLLHLHRRLPTPPSAAARLLHGVQPAD